MLNNPTSKLGPSPRGWGPSWLDEPMNTESEVFQQAVTLVNDHGEDAPIYDATRAQTLLDQDDPVGHALWKGVAAMNRFMTRAAVGTLAIVAIAAGSTMSARAASDTASANTTIVSAIAINNTTAFDFASIVAGAPADTVVVSAAGARTCGTTQTCTGTGAAASFDVTGEANPTYSIPPSASVSVTPDANSMTVDTFTSNPTLTGTLDGAGAQILAVGATLNVRIMVRKPRDLPSGEYRSSMLFRACHACESICGSGQTGPTDSPRDRLPWSSMHPAVLSILLNLRCGVHQRLAEDREDSCEICSRSLRITN